ncbi:hypothetical protein GCM10009527_093940 [Actinomadura nitritigenes]|uniref:Uncharacterized protein n=1 Tax=Actinomadura nitritigenes TaxID=134602 RepID=A0ABS3QUB7_9ACTN|nr:hypothetical protein [Actinomadura nitritigenes]MBO2437212.1 hypothetical protein [Actinomadura nitritigenes]
MRDGAGWLVPLRRSDDPGRWREAVSGSDPVVTKVEFDPGTGWNAALIAEITGPHRVTSVGSRRISPSGRGGT